MVRARKNQKIRILLIIDGVEIALYTKILETLYDRLVLALPKGFMPYQQYLQEGCEVIVCIDTQSGALRYDAMILDGPFEENFTVEYRDDIVPINHNREYVRVPIVTEMTIHSKEHEVYYVTTINIGGGGIKFFSEYEFAPDERVECFITLDGNNIRFKGKIRQLPQPHNFVIVIDDIKEQQRDLIIKSCLRHESDLYKN